MSNTIKPFLFFLIILAAITYGSLSPGDTAQEFQIFHFENSDKLMHAIMYFLLTISLIYGMVKKTGIFKNWKVYVVVVVAPVSYGLFMEFLQYLITQDRQAEAGDFLANIIGVGLAFFFAFLYYSSKKKLMV
ncbi:MAG: VanZ family protein [Gillisia sp.]